MESAKPNTPSTNVTRNSLLSALAQASVMVAGGINAVVIGARYPASESTDSLFTAFAIYSIWLVVAASIRTALVSRLDGEDPFGLLESVLKALVWAVPMIFVTQILIGVPLLAFAGGENASIGIEALLVFIPAAVIQLGIAVVAAMFALLDDFAAPTRAFATGGITNVATLLLLEPALGLIAMPIAASASSVVTAAILLFALRGKGWRISSRSLPNWRTARPWLVTIGFGAAYALVSQILYLISMLFASTALAEGSATVYTFAYMAVGLVIALSASSGSMALAAPIANSWQGDAQVLVPVEDDVTKLMATTLSVVAGVIAVAGTDVAAAALPGFATHAIDQLVNSGTILCLMAIGSGVAIVPLVAMYAAQRYGSVALVSICAIPVLSILTALALRFDKSVEAISFAASITMVLVAWALLWLAHGPKTPSRIIVQIVQIGLVALPASAIFVIAGHLAGDNGPAANISAAVFGAITTIAYVMLALPSYRELLMRMLRQTIGHGAVA